MKLSARSLKQANKGIQKVSHSRYVGLLRRLCTCHIQHACAREILRLCKKKQWATLLEYADSLSSQKHDDATSHFVANQFAALIRKYPWDPALVKTDPEGEALQAWHKAEHRCHRMNQKFKLYQRYRSPHEELIRRVRGYIEYVLGTKPSIETVYELSNFTGGANLGVHGNRTNLGAKLSSKWSVTPSAYNHFHNALVANFPLYQLLLSEQPVRGEDAPRFLCFESQYFGAFKERVDVVYHNKIAFVPKTAKTFRSIAVEPVGNGFLQVGAGKLIQRKLKSVGLDIKDQSRNRFFSKFGSEDWLDPNCFCTIDLSSASDSISIEVCRAVLPHDWFVLLNQIRSKEYLLAGSTYTYEKFCSMGNGFCFPLETLLFAAIATASGAGIPRRDFVVYGDDIIVRKPHFDAVVSALKVFGFKVNKRKTFSEGPFRESCGADWYAGEDVRPYTLDHALDSVQNVFKFLNLSRRNVRTSAFFWGAYPIVLGWIPKAFHLFRPIKGPEDSGIDLEGFEHLVSRQVNLDRKTWVYKWYELQSSPVRDRTEYSEQVRVLCLLRGDSTLYLRRRNTTRVVRKYGG